MAVNDAGKWEGNMNQEIHDYVADNSLEFTIKDLSQTEAAPIGTATLCRERFFPCGFSSELLVVDPQTDFVYGLLHVRVFLDRWRRQQEEWKVS